MAGFGTGGGGGTWSSGGSSIGGSQPPKAKKVGQPASVGGCPPGTTGVAKITKPAPAGSPYPSVRVCPPGATEAPGGNSCCSGGGGGGGIGGIDLGGIGGGGAGGGAGGGSWTPGNVERPNLTPIDPQAAYDPEMAAQLAQQRQYAEQLNQGGGRQMEVLTQAQADQLEAQVAQARAAAAQAGIPFNEAAFRAQGQKSINAAMAEEKTRREAQYGTAIGASTAAAGAQAGERTQRTGIDLQRDIAENTLALDRYGRDIQKYGIDAQAATSANNALLNFYSQLMGGMFGMFGSLGSMSSSNTNYYG